MRYLIAIFCPPLAVLLCGRGVDAVLNLLLTCCLWVPGVIHAWLVIGDHKAEVRIGRMEKRLRRRIG